MLPKHWAVAQKNPADIVNALLSARGIKDTKEFFSPRRPHDYTIKEIGISSLQLKKALKIVKSAQKKEGKVVIYGDYDVDGVCATSVMWQVLHEYGLKVFPFIPDRFSDGYGLSLSGLQKIYEQYPDVALIVSVDNGIVAHEAVKEAKKKGIKVIVTDHHEKSGVCKADAVVHTTQVCGTAVVWFFGRELLKTQSPRFIDTCLDLVGISTISDQMKLIGVNRSLAYHGIQALQMTKRVGLKVLCDIAQIEIRKASTYEIGFVLGPRMNAAGRLAHGLDVVRLLCTKNSARAYEIAQSLQSLNAKRQTITADVLTLARAAIKKDQKIIIVKGAFHEGVVGLAAGRLVEETARPAIVFSEGELTLKGSARSVAGFSITEALREFSHLIMHVGGHEMAAGLTIESVKFTEFVSVFSHYVEKNLDDSLLIKKLIIDAEIPLDAVSLNLAQELKKLEPFGNGNPRPTFLTQKVKVVSVKRMGTKSQHLKLTVKGSEAFHDAVMFNLKENARVPELGSEADIVYSIDENNWKGNVSVQLMIKDIHIHDKKQSTTSAKRVSNARRLSSKSQE